MVVEGQQYREEAIDIIYIFRLLWRAKWRLLIFVLLCASLSAIYALRAASWYKAEVLLKLAENRSQQGLSGQLGALGGLASLTGISVGSNTSAESIAMLTSREVVGNFIVDEKLLPILFSAKWDTGTNDWKSGLGADKPDVRDGVKYFNDNVSKVTEDRKTNLIRVEIRWKDPTVASKWATQLVERVNEHMRQRALKESANNVAYLKEQLTTASLVPMQQSIGRVLESELQKLMLANVSKEFALKTIDPAQPPRKRYRPQRTLIVAGAGLASLIIGTLFVFFADAFHRIRIAAAISANQDNLVSSK